MEELTLLYQSYNAPLECPVTRTQQRGMEPARSDSFSYNGRNELTASSLGAAPYGYSYDNIGNRKTARETQETEKKFINAYSILYIFTKLL